MIAKLRSMGVPEYELPNDRALAWAEGFLSRASGLPEPWVTGAADGGVAIHLFDPRRTTDGPWR